MQVLIDKVAVLKGHTIGETIKNRLLEFSNIRKDLAHEVFQELCFCLLTANYSAEGGIRIQKAVNSGFIEMSEAELAKKLAELGHRFPNARAKFIVEARKHINNIPIVLKNLQGDELRYWFVDNIKGLGMKESSHFLRNIGFNDYAIVDFHIIDILSEHGLIEAIPRGRGISRKKYLEIENVLKSLGRELGMNMGELDLYLWYLETGKVLK